MHVGLGKERQWKGWVFLCDNMAPCKEGKWNKSCARYDGFISACSKYFSCATSSPQITELSPLFLATVTVWVTHRKADGSSLLLRGEVSSWVIVTVAPCSSPEEKHYIDPSPQSAGSLQLLSEFLQSHSASLSFANRLRVQPASKPRAFFRKGHRSLQTLSACWRCQSKCEARFCLAFCLQTHAVSWQWPFGQPAQGTGGMAWQVQTDCPEDRIEPELVASPLPGSRSELRWADCVPGPGWINWCK